MRSTDLDQPNRWSQRVWMGVATLLTVCVGILLTAILLVPPSLSHDANTSVLLSPLAQTNSGARGKMVTHHETLVNITGATDTFRLTLGSYDWDTGLSADSLGPILSGASASFSVYVTVPLGVDWYLTDTVAVSAISIADPTVYSDSARITTLAYAPPEISVSPDILTSTQFVDKAVTKTLTISNGNGVTLAFKFVEQGTLPVQEGSAAYYPFNGNDGAVVGATPATEQGVGDLPWLSMEPVSGTIPTNSSLPVEVTFDASGIPSATLSTHLIVQSNDPVRPILSVPVTMTVIPMEQLFFPIVFKGYTVEPGYVVRGGDDGNDCLGPSAVCATIIGAPATDIESTLRDATPDRGANEY